MAHYAKLNEDNIVTEVHCVDDATEAEKGGEAGVEIWLKERHGGFSWKKTSKDTRRGVHKLGGTPFRKNYCGRGWLYHPSPIDGFARPKPYESWLLDEETCVWEAPIPMPDDASPDKPYGWNEDSGAWEEFTG